MSTSMGENASDPKWDKTFKKKLFKTIQPKTDFFLKKSLKVEIVIFILLDLPSKKATLPKWMVYC